MPTGAFCHFSITQKLGTFFTTFKSARLEVMEELLFVFWECGQMIPVGILLFDFRSNQNEFIRKNIRIRSNQGNAL